MALSQKHKDIKDKKSTELDDKVAILQQRRAKLVAQQQAELALLDQEIDETTVLSDALKSLK